MIRRDIVISIVIAVLLTGGSARVQELNVEQIVKQKIQPILPKNGEGGGVAVAVRMNGKTSFLNYGMADDAKNRPVTADSILISALLASCSRPHRLHKPSSRANSASTIRWPNTLPSCSEAVISAG
jgi:hypothetical protein